VKKATYLKIIAGLLLYLVVSLPAVFSAELSLTYDANGNLVTGDGKYREYNSLNQLWKIYNGSNSSGDLLQEYEYHPIEERMHVKVSYNGDGSNETTIYISENFVRVINSSGTFDFTYVYHNGQQIAQVKPSGDKEFIHNDHLGSTSIITNESGAIIENTTYSPYGEIIAGGQESRKDYTGKEFDLGLEEYDFGARMYKAEWGLFTKADSIIPDPFEPQAFNRYSYAKNNPFRYIDPDGFAYCDAVQGCVQLVDVSGGVHTSGPLTLEEGELGEYSEYNGYEYNPPWSVDKAPEGKNQFWNQLVGDLFTAIGFSLSTSPFSFTGRTSIAPPKPGDDVLSEASKKGFSSDELLQKHFAKHKDEFGFKTVKQYDNAAKSFASSNNADIQQYIRPNGDVLRYNPASNEFLVASSKGTIRTYFKPRAGYSYYYQQTISGEEFIIGIRKPKK